MEKTNFEEIINRKLKGKNLEKEDIDAVISAYVNEKLPENIMISFLTAIFKNGMSDEEIYHLTKAMQNSGITLDLSELGSVADKHSTGGVSDSTTFLIVPIVASLGVKMLKMSGKSLGFTGGTADKILCFKGLKNNLEIEQAIEITKQTNGCFITQSDLLAPADKKMYALRDKVGLIESIPLIASSILSKKLASGSDIIILDVKFGAGAFIKNKNEAGVLAKIMVDILKKEGKKACAVLSSMEQPLGDFVGDELEVMESISILKGLKKNKLFKLSEFLSALIIERAKGVSFNQAKKQVHESISSGKALTKFKAIVKAQGGSLVLFNKDLDIFKKVLIKAETNGFVQKINTEKLGLLTRQFKQKYAGFSGIENKAGIGKLITKDSQLVKLYFEPKHFKKIDKIEIKNMITSYAECFEILKIKVLTKLKLIESVIE
ncbi:MAG: thymidine phosphorylase [Clostridia bacterium]|nr:thymidine phosphorylase [Clostridia bacterium]